MGSANNFVLVAAAAVLTFLTASPAIAELPEDTGVTAGTMFGPDVTVTDLSVGNPPSPSDPEMRGPIGFGFLGDISAFAVGTTSCNIGDTSLRWEEFTSRHPVIAQNMYRLKDGRLEQIGMAWVKHGFASVNEDFCGTCVHPGTNQLLGPNCSDPYVAGLNGNQNSLGPRSEVNAATGFFPYPPTTPPPPATIGFRLQVHEADLDPDLNGGAIYLLEAQYVTADDAAAENDDNNASYRTATVAEANPPSTIFTVSVAGATVTQRSAVEGWQDLDPSVVLAYADAPGDGRFIVGAKVTDHGNGFWTYEYAVFNMNSDRSAGSFSIALHSEAAVQSMGFHDVDYHSGEPYSLVDWAGSFGGGAISWATEDHSVNANANALRWSTTYNFRFRTNSPPVANSMITIGLFKPGSPASVTVATLGPSPDAPDCNGNMIEDYLEIQGNPLLDCDGNGNLDECDLDCDGNEIPDACDIANDPALDCDSNGALDSCEISQMILADCNDNGLPDRCEIDAGSSAPGGPFYCTSDCDPDCNENGVPDACDIAGGAELDCDGNTVPDSCQIAGDPGLDCNNNGILDACGETDCNNNSIPDDCEGPACPGILKGDMDCSGTVNELDISPFIEAVLAGDSPCQTDFNLDSTINGLDLQGFVSSF